MGEAPPLTRTQSAPANRDPDLLHPDASITRLPPTTFDGSESPAVGKSSTSGVKASSRDTPNFGPSRDPSAPTSPSLLPSLSRRSSFLSGNGSYSDDWDAFPPLDRLTVFDLLDNLALPQRLERFQSTISAQTDKVRRQRERIKNTGLSAKERVVEEWRRRIPPPDEQLEKYRRKMKSSVDLLGKRWSDTKAVTSREKLSFMAGVFNIFFSGYLIGALPQYFYIWYTVQLCYFMPIRCYTYHKRGYHYFLADLCYFVNLLAILSLWVFPQSKRLFISTYCLAYGNNAVAIAMWRNSMVFHSLDKVTRYVEANLFRPWTRAADHKTVRASLFIHIMPPVTLHCLVHLIPAELQRQKFPAIYAIKYSLPSSHEHYSLWAMMFWATVPYAVWQLSYHLLITIRRREKIAAGRPTSFTWLRKSYSKTWIGQLVLALPDVLQEPAFMLIQYAYAVITMSPCPLWFWHRYLSAAFLFCVFGWSVYNGATYYIDVFGKRFQTELEQLRKDVAKWQNSPDMISPSLTPRGEPSNFVGATTPLMTSINPAEDAVASGDGMEGAVHTRTSSFDRIPLLDGKVAGAVGTTAIDRGVGDTVRERR